MNSVDRLYACLDRVVAASKDVVRVQKSTFKARNGREVGIEADDGEKCLIVHSDQMSELEAALDALDKERATVRG